MFRPILFVVGIVTSALILALVGFGLGWFFSGRQIASLSEDSPQAETTSEARPRTNLPETDLPGKDFPDLPRYPDSVRVEYERGTSAGLSLIDTEYVASAELDDAREFYREVFRSEGWMVAGLDASEGEWDFFVTKRERESVVEIESKGKFVEIEIEVSEPLKDGEASGSTTDSQEATRLEATAFPSGPADFGDDYDDDYDDEIEDD